MKRSPSSRKYASCLKIKSARIMKMYCTGGVGHELRCVDRHISQELPLSKIPKDKREEKALATLKAEGREWATKIVKIGGKKTCSVPK